MLVVVLSEFELGVVILLLILLNKVDVFVEFCSVLSWLSVIFLVYVLGFVFVLLMVVVLVVLLKC